MDEVLGTYRPGRGMTSEFLNPTGLIHEYELAG
jgi:hypothetical protein